MSEPTAPHSAVLTDDPIQDPQRLAALKETCLLDAPRDPAFDRLTDLATRLLKVPVALVTLIDEGRQFFAGSTGLEPPLSETRQTPIELSFCQHVVRRGEQFVVPDARDHELLKDHWAVVNLGIVAYCGVPLRTAEGMLLGSVCAVEFAPRDWSDDDIDVLDDLAQAAMAEVQARLQIIRLEAQKEELDGQAAALTRALHDREMQIARFTGEIKTTLLPASVSARLVQLDSRLPSELRQEVEVIRRSLQDGGALVRELMVGPPSEQ